MLRAAEGFKSGSLNPQAPTLGPSSPRHGSQEAAVVKQLAQGLGGKGSPLPCMCSPGTPARIFGWWVGKLGWACEVGGGSISQEVQAQHPEGCHCYSACTGVGGEGDPHTMQAGPSSPQDPIRVLGGCCVAGRLRAPRSPVSLDSCQLVVGGGS